MDRKQQVFTSRQYYEIEPLNNVEFFGSTSSQSVCRFSLPPMGNRLLNEMLFCGDVVVELTDQDSFYTSDELTDARGTTLEIATDSVNAIHNFIEKVEISTRRGALLLEENNTYDLTAKVKNSSKSSEVDLNVGRDNNMNFTSQFNSGSMRRLTADLGAAPTDGSTFGQPFAVELEMGLLKDADSRIALDKVGGLEVIIHLNTDANALFNLNMGNTNLIGTNENVRYQLRNLRIFGSYQVVNPASMGMFESVNFKEYSLNQQVLNSANDTNGFSPQVQSMDNIVVVAQPNSSARNNFDTDAQQTNNVVGLKDYKVSRNGVSFPYDFRITNTTALPDITPSTATIGDGTITGNPEQVFHLLISQQGSYPPYHILTSPRTESESLKERKQAVATNFVSTNFMPIAISYQYGFSGYNTNMTTDLVQLNINSSIKTQDPFVDDAVRDQAQTLNNLYKYNASLNYSNLMVAK
jgi:hypothetical protein